MFDKSALPDAHALFSQIFFQNAMEERRFLSGDRDKQHEPAIFDHSKLRS
tara:strand:- start:18 stop:167 length:150 start_codon:yes stop_codon:yes gene_type:complete